MKVLRVSLSVQNEANPASREALLDRTSGNVGEGENGGLGGIRGKDGREIDSSAMIHDEEIEWKRGGRE